MTVNLTSEIINKIFKKPGIQYGLTEFEKIKPSVEAMIEKGDRNDKHD